MKINPRFKAHRRYLKRHGIWQLMAQQPHRWNDRFMGYHGRWWALGQYALKFGRPCADVRSFLADVNFVGVAGALDWSDSE